MHCMTIAGTTNFSDLAASVHSFIRWAKNHTTLRRLSICPFMAVTQGNGSWCVLRANADIWVGLDFLFAKDNLLICSQWPVLLERLYAKRGLPVKKYSTRGGSLFSWHVCASCSWKTSQISSPLALRHVSTTQRGTLRLGLQRGH